MSVLLNGSLEGFFSRSCGVKQGNLLSLIIFCLAKDFLSCYIARLVEEGSITHISSPRGFSAFSHLILADYILFFAVIPDEILWSFWMPLLFIGTSLVHGLIIKKSHNYSREDFSSRRSEDLIQLSGFQRNKFLFVYLGVPLFKGAPKLLGCSHWHLKLKYALRIG